MIQNIIKSLGGIAMSEEIDDDWCYIPYSIYEEWLEWCKKRDEP